MERAKFISKSGDIYGTVEVFAYRYAKNEFCARFVSDHKDLHFEGEIVIGKNEALLNFHRRFGEVLSLNRDTKDTP